MIMPFEIVTLVPHPSLRERLNSTFQFTKTGQALFSTVIPEDDLTAEVCVFDHQVYFELLAIQTEKDAKAFMERHPESLFHAFVQDRRLSLMENGLFTTLDDYCAFAASAVQTYKDFDGFIRLNKKHKKEPSEKLWAEMREIYIKHFDHVKEREDWESFELMEHEFESVYGVEEYEKTQEAPNYHYDSQAVAAKTQKAVYKQALSDMTRYVNRIIRHAHAIYNIATETFEYRCPDYLTAMYMMTFLAIHNEEEYRVCANPRCRQYFVVNRSHPQTLCPKHMAARQRKRQNQKMQAKQKKLEAIQQNSSVD